MVQLWCSLSKRFPFAPRERGFSGIIFPSLSPNPKDENPLSRCIGEEILLILCRSWCWCATVLCAPFWHNHRKIIAEISSTLASRNVNAPTHSTPSRLVCLKPVCIDAIRRVVQIRGWNFFVRLLIKSTPHSCLLSVNSRSLGVVLVMTLYLVRFLIVLSPLVSTAITFHDSVIRLGIKAIRRLRSH